MTAPTGHTETVADAHLPPSRAASPSAALAPLPKTRMDYVRALGPGLLVSMAWLSAGDLVSASVSGSTYGYALMWALVLALFARFFFVSAIGKYVLCNSHGDTSILGGFARLWRGLPLVVGGIGFVLGFTYQTYIIKGAATALYQLAGGAGDGEWSLFLVASALVGTTIFMLLRGRQYTTLETIAKVSVGILMLTFFLAVAIKGFDLQALLRGLVFQVPPDTEGAFGAVVILASIIGAVGGSAANLLYPYFMEEKGWTTPAYRKLQVFDLLVGIAAMVVINLAVWIVAAESLGGEASIAIREAEDLAVMVGRGIGTFGPLLLWIGLFFVTFTSFPTYSFGFTKVLLDGVQRTFPGGRAADEIPAPENHRAFKWIQIGLLLVLPLLFSLPGAPNFISLTIAGTALAAITGPIIIVGVIVLTTSRRFMLPQYANRWWETLALLAIGGIGLSAAYAVVLGMLT
jgi:Mn2+/Fe2+ NRAMP family transporter